MVLLPQLLSGITVPSMATLLTQDSSKTNKSTAPGDSSKANNTTASGKNTFSDILKSQLNNQAGGTGNVNATSKLQERLKTLAAEINKTADAERAKESITASIAGATTAGNLLSSINQTNTIKADTSQQQKLATTNTTPTAQTPESSSQIKLSGENPGLVLVTSKDQANNAGFNRYRMESLAMNKRGVTGGNVMVGLRIPIG